jgi:hypothetical protein
MKSSNIPDIPEAREVREVREAIAEPQHREEAKSFFESAGSGGSDAKMINDIVDEL